MAERTTWSQKHTTDCRSVHCPCYRDGLDDQTVAAGPSAVQAGAEIARLRAEVESLRTQLAAARAEIERMPLVDAMIPAFVDDPVAHRLGFHDADCDGNHDASTARAQAVMDLESDLAAVRTDLSEARRALEDIAREDYRGPRPSGAVKAAAALVLLDQSESAGAGGPLPEA